MSILTPPVSPTIWPFNEMENKGNHRPFYRSVDALYLSSEGEMKIQRSQSEQGPSESSPTRPAASLLPARSPKPRSLCK